MANAGDEQAHNESDINGDRMSRNPVDDVITFLAKVIEQQNSPTAAKRQISSIDSQIASKTTILPPRLRTNAIATFLY
jgi:hypothetical protein